MGGVGLFPCFVSAGRLGGLVVWVVLVVRMGFGYLGGLVFWGVVLLFPWFWAFWFIAWFWWFGGF